MGKEAAIVIFLGVLYLKVCLAASLNRSSIDESSLLALKKHINSDILVKNWLQETSFCSWIGVSCSQRHPRVTGLDISNMGLRGTIAREIGNLSFLTILDMSNNSINGLIPVEIGNLRHLRALNMAFNEFSGHIPQNLGFLRKLERLDMSYNNLIGNIPLGFGNFSRLQGLSLRNNQLTGELPSTIFNISSLLTIILARNQMSGNIPNDICSEPATKIEWLVLEWNQFEGEIPSTLMRCHSLEKLYLPGNKFRGSIPSEFWNLSTIVEVGLGRNELSGTIPPSIGNLSNLVRFDIGDNRFHGTVPSEIGQLTSLKRMRLSLNNLNGEFPQSIFNLSGLLSLVFSVNNVSGYLPFSIDEGLPNIELLYLGENHFRGDIPNSISNLSTLKKLDLNSNSFTGYIPVSLGNLRQLEMLGLGLNQLTNNMSKPEQDFLSSLATCDYLNLIQFSGNRITGVLPKSLSSSNLSASLERFVAESCQIISPLPNEIGNLSSLILLNLGYNDLTGAIPAATLGRLRNLQELKMQGNKLQGSISNELCNLNNLYSVDLSENDFSGELPRCLGNLYSLKEISLAGNAFSSNIPSTLWFNGRVEKIYFSNNLFNGSLSRDIGNMKRLIVLDLSGNQLSGEIPSTFSQLANLINLSLSNNRFEGPILESFANLKGLLRLDLSQNNLSGSIPKSFEKLAYLNYFNVSFNGLSGEIPDGGPFANFTAEYFLGNKGLCGAPRFKVEECKRNMSTSSRKNKLLKYILPTIASVVAAALILIFVLRSRGRKLLSSSLSDLPLGLTHERISYHEILRATGNLDEENLIGRGTFGSVYKGNFSNATVAAVKVFNLDEQGVLKSFDTECQIMRNIRHRNLVKVITSCSNLDFKALLMAYMPNGNLEKWLYSAGHSFNILQRLGIMIDVANAIEYLHAGYTYPIVHCDLKPNNILLDEDMVAHVGDFGIAKLLTEEQRMLQTRTLGTIGYMAPEYGSEGLISTMVDVYSYGILLMEMFTRKKPTDEMFSGELTMRQWVSESFPRSVMAIVDDELRNMDDQSMRTKHESCLTSTIGLALECTTYLPEERPNMKDVLVRIRKIKSNYTN